jgi:hypothetical protein
MDCPSPRFAPGKDHRKAPGLRLDLRLKPDASPVGVSCRKFFPPLLQTVLSQVIMTLF